MEVVNAALASSLLWTLLAPLRALATVGYLAWSPTELVFRSDSLHPASYADGFRITKPVVEL